MATVDIIRDSVIEKLFAITNKEYLLALSKLIDSSDMANKPIKLTASQIEMLKLSEEDIKAGRLIPHEEVVQADKEWLKEL